MEQKHLVLVFRKKIKNEYFISVLLHENCLKSSFYHVVGTQRRLAAIVIITITAIIILLLSLRQSFEVVVNTAPEIRLSGWEFCLITQQLYNPECYLTSWCLSFLICKIEIMILAYQHMHYFKDSRIYKTYGQSSFPHPYYYWWQDLGHVA